MAKGVFITATGTDTGKTYVTALIVKKLRKAGINCGYYKAALSGAETVAESDAGYVNKTAGINQPEDTLVSYMYKTAVSPHLAARLEGDPVEMEVVKADFARVCKAYDYITAEGSGGIVCPVRHDEKAVIYLEDIIKELNLSTVIVADSGLGAINSAVTTAEYMKSRNIHIGGIILNNWTGGVMQEDNRRMIEELTSLPVCAVVRPGDKELDMDLNTLKKLYKEI